MAYKKTDKGELRVMLPSYVLEALDNIALSLGTTRTEVIYSILSSYAIERFKKDII